MKTRAGLLFLVLLTAIPPAAADDTTGGTDDGGLYVVGVESKAQKPGSMDVGGGAAPTSGVAPFIVIHAVACTSTKAAAAGAVTEATLCLVETTDDPEPRAITAADARRAFARLPLPASTLVIQPPDGVTLVNFDTNFYTTSTTPITRRVRLLGRPVTIQATPSEYHWHFDDGASLTTTEPGTPYPSLTVTHNYTTKDTYAPRLDTTYTGRFRVGNAPWQAIPGTVTIAGTPHQLRAIEAQPKLVAPYGR